MLERSVHLLACEFHVTADTERVLRWLDAVLPSAVQDHPVSRRHRLDVREDAGGYRVREDGEDRGVHASPEDAAALVERRLHELAFAAFAGCTKIHAGCATWDGRRFLVVGHGRAGKTTLMTRLLVDGFPVEGDEMVLVRDGQVTAYPRRFGIRRRTLRLVPQVGALAPELATVPPPDEPDGYHVLALDPSQLGLRWRIRTGPVDILLLLEGRHAGPTQARSCPDQLMVQSVMAQSDPPSSGPAAWVRDVCALVRGAAKYLVILGDLDSAVAVVRQCVGAPADARLSGAAPGGPDGDARPRPGQSAR